MYRRRKNVHRVTLTGTNRHFQEIHKSFGSSFSPVPGFMRPSSKIPKDPPTPPSPPKIHPSHTSFELDAVSTSRHPSALVSPLFASKTQYSAPPVFEIDGQSTHRPLDLQNRPISELSCQTTFRPSSRPISMISDSLTRLQSEYIGTYRPFPLGLPTELKECSVYPSSSCRTTLSAVSSDKIQPAASIKERPTTPKAQVISWMDSDGNKQQSPLQLRYDRTPLKRTTQCTGVRKGH